MVSVKDGQTFDWYPFMDTTVIIKALLMLAGTRQCQLPVTGSCCVLIWRNNNVGGPVQLTVDGAVMSPIRDISLICDWRPLGLIIENNGAIC